LDVCGGREESVIDWKRKQERWDMCVCVEIRDRIESDHHTVIAWMKKRERRRNREGRRRRLHRGIWEKWKLLEPD